MERHRLAGMERDRVTWTSPPVGWYKANWDVAIDKLTRRVGISMIVLIAARCLTQGGPLTPILAEETLALYHAACHCKDLDGKPIILEGDALQVVTTVNSSEQSWSHFGHLVAYTKIVLQMLLEWSCRHVRRKANVIAHRLAKAAVQHVIDNTWWEKFLIVFFRELQALFSTD
ncbi:uncharacterized protein LOC132187980 [Corylus avellana]|uniref:uncharacterized protein LOC132187980 n=1 Tax=Corylus avellana TaxID=13451 RepID=UPI00286BD197|nr:uncharacterized protein LOC132187980 [Corylus avellana]